MSTGPAPLEGALVFVLIVAALVFFVALALAPLMLYGISSKLSSLVQLQEHQCRLLARIGDQLAAVARPPVTPTESTPAATPSRAPEFRSL